MSSVQLNFVPLTKVLKSFPNIANFLKHEMYLREKTTTNKIAQLLVRFPDPLADGSGSGERRG